MHLKKESSILKIREEDLSPTFASVMNLECEKGWYIC